MFTSIKLCREILMLFIISIPNLEAVYDFDSGSCFFEDWSIGECKPVIECPELLNQLKVGIRPTIVSCGFVGAIQIGCCNISSLDETSSSSIPDLPTKMKVTSRAEEKCEEYIRTMPGSVATQIIGGTEAGLGEFPHMVALGYENKLEIEFDCGGTLISDRYVVTAAHCVVLKGRDPPTLGRVGIVDLNGNYDKNDTDFYIEAIFPTRNIKVIDITMTSLYLKISKSQYLKKGSVSSVSIVTCNVTMTRVKEFKLPVGLIHGQICAMDKNFIMDTCGGDSGGPLQIPYADSYLYKLIGVTSFGKACSGGIPAVYTRISSYLGWIEDIVWPIDS